MTFANAIEGARKSQSDANLQYPAYAKLLRLAGVESYTVNVATLATKYAGKKGESHAEAGSKTRTIADAYNNGLVESAVRSNQRGELDGPAFIDKLAAAGVANYEARLGDYVIVYEGHGGSYAEAIPR